MKSASLIDEEAVEKIMPPPKKRPKIAKKAEKSASQTEIKQGLEDATKTSLRPILISESTTIRIRQR